MFRLSTRVSRKSARQAPMHMYSPPMIALLDPGTYSLLIKCLHTKVIWGRALEVDLNVTSSHSRWHPQHHMLLLPALSLLSSLLYPIMASPSSTSTPTPTNSTDSPVTRIACFKFYPNVTAAQKAGRTSAFLDLYAQHQDLILSMPKGGRPLNTPLALTNVKREKEWDTGFVVVFKVRLLLLVVSGLSWERLMEVG